jgi:anaerobic C4-dicarboxylate transporter
MKNNCISYLSNLEQNLTTPYFDIECVYEGYIVTLRAKRLETDQEVEKRLSEERKNEKSKEQAKERRRKEYERLKEEFE